MASVQAALNTSKNGTYLSRELPVRISSPDRPWTRARPYLIRQTIILERYPNRRNRLGIHNVRLL